MKNLIWITFVVLALIWTAVALAASGLAGWTSDAMASGRVPKASQQIAQTTETITRSVKSTLTDASVQLKERITTTVTQPVGAAAASVAAAAANAPTLPPLPPLPPLPALPPLPEWMSQLFPPETVQSIKQWSTQVQAAVAAGGAAVASAARTSASAAPLLATEAASRTVAQAATPLSATASDAVAQAPQVAEPMFNQATASSALTSASAAAPWLANAAGWLVAVVWIIWGIGLMVGLIATLIAQRLLGRFSRRIA